MIRKKQEYNKNSKLENLSLQTTLDMVIDSETGEDLYTIIKNLKSEISDIQKLAMKHITFVNVADLDLVDPTIIELINAMPDNSSVMVSPSGKLATNCPKGSGVLFIDKIHKARTSLRFVGSENGYPTAQRGDVWYSNYDYSANNMSAWFKYTIV